MVVPPSIHPETGKPYEWIVSPWDFQERFGVPFPELPTAIYEKIKTYQEKPQVSPGMELAQTEDNSLGSLDVPKYLRHHGVAFKLKRDGGRAIYALEQCLFADQHTTKDVKGDSSIIQGADGKLGYHCFHNHCAHKTWKDARQAISGDGSIAQFCRGYDPSGQKKPVKLMPLITAKDLEGMELREATPVIGKGILPAGGGGVFAGPSGIGKSVLCTEIAIRLSQGMDIFSFRVPKPRQILIVQKENALPQVKHRVVRISKGLGLSHAPENLFMTPVNERFNLQRRDDVGRLSQYIERMNAEVAILDPLSSFHSYEG